MTAFKYIDKNFKRLVALVFFVLLQSCSETSSNKEPAQVGLSGDDAVIAELCDSNSVIAAFKPGSAFVATTAADFGSGAHAVISGDVSGQFTSLNNLNPTSSDITIATYGDYFYVIERQGGGNSITKYAINNPQLVIWQYSINEPSATVASNPHDIIFVSETKAYVLRYNKTRAWVVNPSATSEADFKIGELDLSAYGATDGIPEMDTGFVAGGRLYIVLQRLEGVTQQVVNDAYIAMFDVNTDIEIDANIPGDLLKGFPLVVRNPTSINYLPTTNTLFVQGSGSFFPVQYVGGIEAINLSDFSSSLILDDGDDATHPYGLITSLAVVSPNRLFFVGYESYTTNTLYVMDVDTQEISPVNVSQLIAGQIESLAIDSQGLLWVSDNANATVRIINPLSCNEIDAVSTNLNPSKIVFAQ